MHTLTATAMRIAEIANITLHKNMPFVGRSAFAHKAGMHADGVLKNERSFEHIDQRLWQSQALPDVRDDGQIRRSAACAENLSGDHKGFARAG